MSEFECVCIAERERKGGRSGLVSEQVVEKGQINLQKGELSQKLPLAAEY